MKQAEAFEVLADVDAKPADLAKIAYEFADLRVRVAKHPKAYRGLLKWLQDFGDRKTAELAEARLFQLDKEEAAQVDKPAKLPSLQKAESQNSQSTEQDHGQAGAQENQGMNSLAKLAQTNLPSEQAGQGIQGGAQVVGQVVGQGGAQVVGQAGVQTVGQVVGQTVGQGVAQVAGQGGIQGGAQVLGQVVGQGVIQAIPGQPAQFINQNGQLVQLVPQNAVQIPVQNHQQNPQQVHPATTIGTPLQNAQTPQQFHGQNHAQQLPIQNSQILQNAQVQHVQQLPVQNAGHPNSQLPNQQLQQLGPQLQQSQIPHNPMQNAVHPNQQFQNPQIQQNNPNFQGQQSLPNNANPNQQNPQQTRPANWTMATALDPGIDLNLMADMAQNAPDLREYIAVNRSAYPALLDWLRDLDDPVINRALQSRDDYHFSERIPDPYGLLQD